MRREAYNSLMPKAEFEVARVIEGPTRSFGLCKQHFVFLCQKSAVLAVALDEQDLPR